MQHVLCSVSCHPSYLSCLNPAFVHRLSYCSVSIYSHIKGRPAVNHTICKESVLFGLIILATVRENYYLSSTWSSSPS